VLALSLASGIIPCAAALAQSAQDSQPAAAQPATPAVTQPPANPAPAKPAAPKPAAAKAAAAKPVAAKPPITKKRAATGTPTRYLPNRFAGRAGLYYKTIWGVDSLSVKMVESGEIIRFAWRVLDPGLAHVLNDKSAEPSLEDPRAGVALVVPTMEQIGQLRQSAPPEAGRSYWMAFSNKGRTVKRGDMVNVVVGTFRADGLMVD
jgi:hypothetical protein